MKKLFNWMIEHTRHYIWLHCLYTDMLAVNEKLSAVNKKLSTENEKLLAENKEIKKLLGKAESQLIEIEKIINRYTNAKDIKKYIKEVL